MKIITSLFLLFLSVSLFAQRPEREEIIVSGTILEEGTNLPLEYATVSFIDKDNKIVTGGITDMKGKYKIEVLQGMYTIQYEFISYKTKQLTKQRLFKGTTLPTMYLALDSESLDEVVVRAETTEVQVRLDKKIYNIGKDLTTSGATVSDALSNVPSVAVDVDGAISLRGNENVRILINGKPSAMAGFGSTDALSQLPAESIERVEVITSPSARYDAEGTAGILNIILRKEKTLGLNGSLSANYNVPLGSGLTTNINLRTNKFNIFNTTGIRYNDTPGNATYENTYFSESVENPFLLEERRYERLRQGFNTNLGVEYFINDQSSVTATGFLRTGDNGTTTTNNTDEYNRDNDLAIQRVRTEEETEDDLNYQATLNYTNKFDKNGHELTVDFQYEKGEETEDSSIEEYTIFGENEVIPSESITTKEDETEFLAKADYVLPIGENAQFEAGFNSRFQETVTDYLLLQEDVATGNFVRNDDLSNVFTYNENINAFYTQYGNKFGDFSFLVGLRLENTQLKGEVDSEIEVNSNNPDFDLDFDKNYTGLFPTVNLIYELAENENITIGYNRRINRPRSWFINPFPSRSSEANIFQGNPNLDPAYASAFDLGYLKRWGRKITLTSSVYYQHETDAFERVQEDTGEVTANGIPIIRTIPINLATNKRYGFEAGLLYNPTKWLRLNGSFNFFKFETEGIYNNVDYGTSNTSYFGRGSAKVSLPASIEWQTNAFYRGPSSTAQSENDGILSVDVALSKEIMNDNATIGFNVRDLFNTRKRNSITETDTFISESEFQWRQRQFTVSFMYRFNEKKKRERPNRGGSIGDGEEGFEG